MPIFASTWGPVAAWLTYTRRMAWMWGGPGVFFNPNASDGGREAALFVPFIREQLASDGGAQPGQRVLFLWFYGRGFYSHGADQGLPWAESGAAAMRFHFGRLLAALRASGVAPSGIDAVVINNEEAGGFTTFGLRAPGAGGETLRQRIMADPRGAAWGDGANDDPVWNRAAVETNALYMRRALEPLAQYFPAATLSAYDGYAMTPDNAVGDPNGYILPQNSSVGLPAPALYGVNNNTPFPRNNFGALLQDVNTARAVRRSSSSPLQPWVQPSALLEERVRHVVTLGVGGVGGPGGGGGGGTVGRILVFNPDTRPFAAGGDVSFDTMMGEINREFASVDRYSVNPAVIAPGASSLSSIVVLTDGSTLARTTALDGGGSWERSRGGGVVVPGPGEASPDLLQNSAGEILADSNGFVQRADCTSCCAQYVRFVPCSYQQYIGPGPCSTPPLAEIYLRTDVRVGPAVRPPAGDGGGRRLIDVLSLQWGNDLEVGITYQGHCYRNSGPPSSLPAGLQVAVDSNQYTVDVITPSTAPGGPLNSFTDARFRTPDSSDLPFCDLFRCRTGVLFVRVCRCSTAGVITPANQPLVYMCAESARNAGQVFRLAGGAGGADGGCYCVDPSGAFIDLSELRALTARGVPYVIAQPSPGQSYESCTECVRAGNPIPPDCVSALCPGGSPQCTWCPPCRYNVSGSIIQTAQFRGPTPANSFCARRVITLALNGFEDSAGQPPNGTVTINESFWQGTADFTGPPTNTSTNVNTLTCGRVPCCQDPFGSGVLSVGSIIEYYGGNPVPGNPRPGAGDWFGSAAGTATCFQATRAWNSRNYVFYFDDGSQGGQDIRNQGSVYVQVACSGLPGEGSECTCGRRGGGPTGLPGVPDDGGGGGGGQPVATSTARLPGVPDDAGGGGGGTPAPPFTPGGTGLPGVPDDGGVPFVPVPLGGSPPRVGPAGVPDDGGGGSAPPVVPLGGPYGLSVPALPSDDLP